MEFEFQNGTGPLDGRSPFAQVSSNAQRFPTGTNTTSKKSETTSGFLQFRQRLNSAAQGTYSAFDSPSKTRTMGSQQSSPNKPLPPTPFKNNLFSTPRKPQPDIDDSSAGETPRSPERRDDSDATPEIVNARSALTKFDNASAPTLPGAEREQASPTKQRPEPYRRESALVKFMSKAKNKIYSPGRGELPRAEHSGAIEKKRSTHRKRTVDRQVARQRRPSISESGEDNDHPPKSPRKRSGQHHRASEKGPHWISNLFTFIGQHPSVPHILSYYAQFLFNVFLMGCFGYLIYCFWSAIQGDVDAKAFEAMAGIIAKKAECAKNYAENNCDPSTRTAFMQVYCEDWYRCSQQDQLKVARATVSAHTFAEIFNSFVEPISWKAMIFTTILVFGCFAISNLAFGFFRQKAQQHQPSYGYGYGYNGPPPPTPQRSFSGQDGAYFPGTPWHLAPQGVGYEPQPSGGYGQIDGQGSPVRRLAYN